MSPYAVYLGEEVDAGHGPRRVIAIDRLEATVKLATEAEWAESDLDNARSGPSVDCSRIRKVTR